MAEQYPNLRKATYQVHHGYLLLSVQDDRYAKTGGWCHSLYAYRDESLNLIEVSGNNGLLIQQARALADRHDAEQQLHVADEREQQLTRAEHAAAEAAKPTEPAN